MPGFCFGLALFNLNGHYETQFSHLYENGVHLMGKCSPIRKLNVNELNVYSY